MILSFEIQGSLAVAAVNLSREPEDAAGEAKPLTSAAERAGAFGRPEDLPLAHP
jgi:hypothetical protein